MERGCALAPATYRRGASLKHASYRRCCHGTYKQHTRPTIGATTLPRDVKRAMDGIHRACEARYAGRYFAGFSYGFSERHRVIDLVRRLASVAMRTAPLADRLTVDGTAGRSGKT